MRNDKIIVFDNIDSLAKYSIEYLKREINDVRKDDYFTIALSGGATPKNLFLSISKDYKDEIDWSKIKIFWSDERCVNPEDEQSNYNMAYNNLLKYVNIPEENIFRMKGEEIPEVETARYSKLLLDELKIINGVPSFDLIMLGLGEDGHTASIFPEQLELFFSDQFCVTSIHPQTKQKRITLTGKVINNAAKVIFLVTGKIKSEKVYEIVNENSISEKYPASYVQPDSGKLIWLLDKESSQLLDKSKINLFI